MAYICTGYMQPELWAIKLGGMGDVSGTHVAWKFTQGVPAKPSILLVGERIYMVADAGVARCLNALTGEQLWQKRLEDNYTASPLYAGGKIYFFSEGGTTTVIEPADEFKPLAENALDGRFMASPAVSGKALILRTDTALYRVED
jgi:outer membrane protein assembly factor BamB